MIVVLVDVDGAALADARAGLERQGVVVHALTADVSDRDAVMALAAQVDAEVGDVWLLVNNAGVSGPVSRNVRRALGVLVGVNLWGVVHGLHAFLPGMVARDSGYVVNTSSVDGLVTVPNAALYVAAATVTALSDFTASSTRTDRRSACRCSVPGPSRRTS